MRHPATGVGSPADQLQSVAILLSQCEDRAAIERRWPRLMGTLEAVLRRVGVVRHRGGSSPAVAAALPWLAATVHDHPGLAEPESAELRAELLSIIGRIRHLAS
jgi:hypothetical protein